MSIHIPHLTLSDMKQYKKNKFTRYFSNHKGRTLFMIICIIILFICAFTQYPINGDIKDDNYLSKFMSLVGYISANVFIALLFTIVGVETYLSREELEQIRINTARQLNDTIQKNKDNPNFLLRLFSKIKDFYKKKIAMDSIHVKSSNATGQGENNNTDDKINIFIISKLLNGLTPDQKIELYEELIQDNKERSFNDIDFDIVD